MGIFLFFTQVLTTIFFSLSQSIFFAGLFLFAWGLSQTAKNMIFRWFIQHNFEENSSLIFSRKDAFYNKGLLLSFVASGFVADYLSTRTGLLYFTIIVLILF